MYRARCQAGGARSTGTGSCRSLGGLEGAEHGCERVRTPAKCQSRGLFVVGWSQRRGDACMEGLKPGAAGRACSSWLNPRKSEPRAVPHAGLVACSWRMLRALSDLVLLHLYILQGWALRPCWEPWDWGTAGLGVPRGDGISPAPHTGCWGGASRLEGSALLLLLLPGLHEVFPSALPSERRSFEENGEFSPLSVALWV